MWKKILISSALFILINAEEDSEESTVEHCYVCGGTTDREECDINTLIENNESYGCTSDDKMCTSAAIIVDGTAYYVRACVEDGCIGLQKGNPTGKFAYCYNCPDSNCNTDVIPDASACAKQLSSEGSGNSTGGGGQASGSISGCGASVSASGTVSAQQTTATSMVETTMKPPKSPGSV